MIGAWISTHGRIRLDRNAVCIPDDDVTVSFVAAPGRIISATVHAQAVELAQEENVPLVLITMSAPGADGEGDGLSFTIRRWFDRSSLHHVLFSLVPTAARSRFER